MCSGGRIVSWGLEEGKVYNRRADIHARFGGQQQGGIITPADHPLVIIITGEEGLEHGYTDRELPDGTFEYFGEGQVGDMPWVRGNRAVRDHSQDGRSLLLFRKTRFSRLPAVVLAPTGSWERRRGARTRTHDEYDIVSNTG